MVTRSTLDPLEEARARVRLRYQRARKVHPGIPQIGLAAERLGRKVGAKKLPAVQLLRRRWREIVGEKPSAKAQAEWSLDTHVSKDAPPTIIFAAADDPTTPPGHGILLFETLIAAGASAELHMFRDGGHGWGLGQRGQVISQWPALFTHWAQSLEIIEKRGK